MIVNFECIIIQSSRIMHNNVMYLIINLYSFYNFMDFLLDFWTVMISANNIFHILVGAFIKRSRRAFKYLLS